MIQSKTMGAKGEIAASKAIKYAIAVILVGVAGTLFSLAIANNEAIGATPNPVVVSIVAQHRLLYSPDCFAYMDPVTRRVYPGIIDADKFTEARLQSCYLTEDPTLPCFGMTIETESQTLGPMYTENYAGCSVRQEMIERPKYVLLHQDDRHMQATLKLRYPRP